MHRPSRSISAFSLATLATLTGILPFVEGCRRPAAPPVALEISSTGPLTFPPPDVGWSDRVALPPRSAAAAARPDAPITLSSPSLDAKGHFETEGQRIQLYFTENVVSTRDAKKAPAFAISPSFPVSTVWHAGSSVEVVADKPFDPQVDYTLSLPDTVAPSGKKLTGFKVSFRATPSLLIGGKTITYLPEPGRARPVEARRGSDIRVAAGGDIPVVYDQAIDLTLAKRLIKLSDEKKAPLAFTVAHPDSDVYEGEKVDRRFVVLVRPVAPLKPESKITLQASAQRGGDPSEEREMTVAAPLRVETIACSSRGECDVRGDIVSGPVTATLEIRLNNPLGMDWDDRRKALQITPPVKNLYVSGYEETITVGGAFAPSTHYTVRIASLRDAFGGALPARTLTFDTRALPASVTIPEGVSLLDEASTRSFTLTTRNTAQAELRAWPVARNDAAAFQRALTETRTRATPKGEPLVITVQPDGRLDELSPAHVDLTQKLEAGRAYVVEARVGTPVNGAKTASFPAGSEAEKPPMALLVTASPSALGAHVHRVGDAAVVDAFRLGSGEPVAGARVTLGGKTGTTDAAGAALLTGIGSLAAGEDAIVGVRKEETELFLPLSQDGPSSASALFPDLAGGEAGGGALVGMIVTDRGVYRPGSPMRVKGFVRTLEPTAIKPKPGAHVRLHVTDPLGADITNESVTTGDRGTFTTTVTFDKSVHTGRFDVKLETDDAAHMVLGAETVRVATFEAPRFKVDVEAMASPTKDKIKARVAATYLFGAPMGKGHVAWTLKKRRLPVKGGLLQTRGLRFDDEARWGHDDAADEALRPVTGEGELDDKGSLVLDVATGPLAKGPTEMVLEADVNDASRRHVAGRLRTSRDPYRRHVGLKLARRWGELGKQLPVEVGVVDAQGNALPDVKVTVRLEHVGWTRSSTRAESGAVVDDWREVTKEVGSCDVVTTRDPTGCDLPVLLVGSYRVTARVDDRDGVSLSYYASGSGGTSESQGVPSAGKKVPVVLDKESYAAGDTAHVLVQSPYAAATALFMVEQGGLVRHEARRIAGPSATFDVPLTAANGPHVHVAVTLLPIGTQEPDYRVGAVRIPVGVEAARCQVRVSSAKPAYEAREEAEITVEVKRGGVPVKNADVTLAVVDEGVLRLTDFHAIDPVTALRPGRPLDFRITDSRAALIARREKAHAAGEGSSEGEDALDTRKNFVETAAWVPDLVTDEQGRVSTKIKLPDSMTEFRMMAVAVDGAGNGGKAESGFVVAKPLLLEPALPGHVLRGDTFEAVAMVHNNTDARVDGRVTIGDQSRDVAIPPHGRERVSVPMTADTAGKRAVRFALAVGGVVRDSVENVLTIGDGGLDDHPRLAGAFGERQEVELAIPADALFEPDAQLSIKTGSNLYPELGQQLAFLLDYPHGCVEQTTSSTLPLIAARSILPWAGMSTLGDEEIKKRIEAGVARLQTMQTASGGLAYWPGESEPNLYGTAYAMQAILGAKAAGIERPHLLEGVSTYLLGQLTAETSPELRVSIAAVLAQAKALPVSAADMLHDTRDKLDAFGLGALAIALSALPQQEGRVKEVLDKLEASFDDKGASRAKHGERDWHTWGSEDRDRAQATIALVRLRPESRLLPTLAGRLARGVERSTTQSTAWGLLAVAEFLGSRQPERGLDVTVKLDGHELTNASKLGGDNKEVKIPLRELVGKTRKLVLEGDRKMAAAFAIEARYRRPVSASGTHVARRAKDGVSVHRVFTDGAGAPVDLGRLKAGQVVRVALRVQLPGLDPYRRSYLAITDPVPGGLEPINPDLATVASAPEVSTDHPFHHGLTSWGGAASHVDLREDRVHVYFDSAADEVYASYLARATTPGRFAVLPALGELMYETDSVGYSDAVTLGIQ